MNRMPKREKNAGAPIEAAAEVHTSPNRSMKTPPIAVFTSLPGAISESSR